MGRREGWQERREYFTKTNVELLLNMDKRNGIKRNGNHHQLLLHKTISESLSLGFLIARV